MNVIAKISYLERNVVTLKLRKLSCGRMWLNSVQ